MTAMRQFLIFLAVVAIAFFAIGEWRGVYLGILGQTPVIAYKTDHTAESSRRTINRDSLPVALTGQVRNGTLRVSVVFERPASFQTGAAGLPAQTVFERTFRTGERVALNELIQEGRGDYTVRLEFTEGTGMFTLRMPAAAEL